MKRCTVACKLVQNPNPFLCLGSSWFENVFLACHKNVQKTFTTETIILILISSQHILLPVIVSWPQKRKLFTYRLQICHRQRKLEELQDKRCTTFLYFISWWENTTSNGPFYCIIIKIQKLQILIHWITWIKDYC